MKIEYIDTESLEQIGNNINNVNEEYLEEINKLFNRIAQVPNKTLEWVGPKSEEYVKVIEQKKPEFLELYSELQKFSDLLINYSRSINEKIQNNLDIERNI